MRDAERAPPLPARLYERALKQYQKLLDLTKDKSAAAP
ncbi:unnamed protein product [Plutella xylostella]|uniref:(diamondback moth) hypothetical protein n=1 Tax=Plutella xylostella TaxID=51655 RepID=A0A8S4DFS1_PLUXY|nr:unnamed protein product [Plutella xylostella]